MSDDAVRRALAALACTTSIDGEEAVPPATDTAESFHETIERATAATRDVEAAAEFVDGGGLDALDRAIDCAERSVSSSATAGRRARTTFREFREAAAGDHFHPGRGTSLGGADLGQSK